MRALLLASVTATATLLLASNALAQVQAQANTGGQAQAGMALPGQAAAVPGDSDHDQMVGRLAVGYLGRRTVNIGAVADPAALTVAQWDTVEAPVVGIRYWIDPMIGIDAGLGFATNSSSWEVRAAGATADGDFPSSTAFLVHVGVPLSLSSFDHFSFQIVPELNVGYGMGSEQGPSPDPAAPAGALVDIDHSGLHLDVGARAGAEIHFGFMGIPQLSLQGSVGVRLDYESLSTDDNTQLVGETVESNLSRLRIATATYDNPWNIFISNVAALYYF